MTNIEIKPGHNSFCVWDLYVEGDFFGQYDSYREAEEAAEAYPTITVASRSDLANIGDYFINRVK